MAMACAKYEHRKQPFTIGFFSRIAPEKGLHLLVEAFALLCADRSLPELRLKAAGYKSSGDEPYFETVMQRVRELGLANRFEFAGELDRKSKIKFLQSLDVMSVPTVYRESKGISVLESLANGVPVVAPRHGSFTEILEHTGGGLLCEPENPADLAAKLRELVINPALVEQLGRQGREAIFQHYSAAQMATQHRALISPIIARHASGNPQILTRQRVVNRNRLFGISFLLCRHGPRHSASKIRRVRHNRTPAKSFRSRRCFFATQTLRPAQSRRYTSYSRISGAVALGEPSQSVPSVQFTSCLVKKCCFPFACSLVEGVRWVDGFMLGIFPGQPRRRNCKACSPNTAACAAAEVISDRETGRSRGFGFVEMESDEGTQAAIAAMNGKDMGGRALTVNEARERTPRPSGGGGGGRGGYGGGGGYGRR